MHSPPLVLQSELKKYEGDKLAGFFIKAAVKLLPFFPDSMDGSFM